MEQNDLTNPVADCYRDFSFGQTQQLEVREFDLLYRINATRNGKSPSLMEGAADLLQDSCQLLLNRELAILDASHHYQLTEKGNSRLCDFGRMYQRFRDLGIFKCVYPEAEAPQDNEPDPRFGGYEEEACPPESEDFRVAILELFFSSQNKIAPLHICAYISYLEYLTPSEISKELVADFANGSLFNNLKLIIDSQPSAEAITPEECSEEEIVAEIYNAGMVEMRRRLIENPSLLQRIRQDDQKFWIEELGDSSLIRNGNYYKPYWNLDYTIGADFCVSAFAGLAN